MKQLLSSVVGVVGAAALLVAVNVAGDRGLAGVQLDLTSQQLYTLSPGTRTVLAGLREPITLRMYYSARLGSRIPQYGAHADHVREMLQQYAESSGGKVRVTFSDPEPFSDAEDRATGYGLQSVPLDQGGERVFFGLEGSNLLDDERTIPFFQPERERFLEYDLTHLIYELSSPKKPVIGVMTALKMNGDPQAMMAHKPSGAPWASMLSLRQAFIVRSIDPDATVIAADVQVLMVVHPQSLPDATLYAIDQFVMRGGRLLAMVAPSSESLPPAPQTGSPSAVESSDLPRLFAAWGIAYDPDEVVGDLTGAWRVRAGANDRLQAVDYVTYFSIRAGINHDDPATADLQEITVAAPGFIAVKPGSNVQMTPLLSSSDQSAVLPAKEVRDNPDPERILAGFKPDGHHRVIAARIHGVLRSAFAKALPGATEPFRRQTDGPANLVVIADTDMLADRYWTRTQDFFGTPQATPFADNGAFVTNLVGTLAGGDALIGLRSRGSVARPFDVVDTMQRNAETKYRRTETTLTTHLEQTTQKLADLRTGKDGTTNAALNEQQIAVVDGLKRDMLDTRGKLRGVQLELRRDISALQTRLRLFDIAFVPGLLLVLAIVLGVVRKIRRTRVSA